MKSKSSIKSVRTEAAVDPDFGAKFKTSMKEVISLLETRFQRLKYKDQALNIGQASKDDDMLTFLQDSASMIDGALTFENADQVKRLHGQNERFKTFLTKHSQERHYSFQLKKCPLDSPCAYCSMCPPRMPEADFAKLHFLPDCVYDKANECFKPFEDVYGQNTNDDDRPSMKEKKAWSTDFDKSHRLVAAKVRDYITCSECTKRRVIYSVSVLTTRQEIHVRRAKDEMWYICGDVLFPAGHDFHDVVYVREGLHCKSQIEATYYSVAQTIMEPCCVFCGDIDVADNDELSQLQQEYGIVRPICNKCYQEGKKPLTRAAKKGRKRKQRNVEDSE